MIESFDGLYKDYESLSFNPLDVAENTQRTRQSLTNTLRAMLGEISTEDLDEALDRVVARALEADIQYRTFNQIYDVAFAARSPLKKAFEKRGTTQKGKEGL